MANPEADKALGYTRVTTMRQEEGASLESQAESIRKYAHEKGFNLIDIVSEVGPGPSLRGRPRLQALLSRIIAKEAKHLIVHAFDRLARNQDHQAVIAYHCEVNKAQLHSATEPFDKSPLGKFHRAAVAFVAEAEYQKIVERTRRGRQSRIDNNKLPALARVPFGYAYATPDKGSLMIDEAIAPIVRRIFVDYANGMSLRKVAQGLTDAQTPTPAQAVWWYPETVRYILGNRAYLGEARVNCSVKEEADESADTKRVRLPDEEHTLLPAGTIPPLIDHELFAAAQERLKQNKRDSTRNSGSPESFLLRTGYIRCGGCGRALGAALNLSRGIYRYQLLGKKPDCWCADKLLFINAQVIDAHVWTLVKSILTDPATIAREVAQQRTPDTTAAEIARLHAAIHPLDKECDNLRRSIARASDDEMAIFLEEELRATLERKQGFMVQMQEIERQRDDWQATQARVKTLEDFCRSVAEDLDEFTYEQKRRALDALRVRVRVFPAGHNPRFEITIDPGVEVAPNGRIVTRPECRSGHNTLQLRWANTDLPTLPDYLPELSDRQREVVIARTAGDDYYAIAAKLGIQPNAVKGYLLQAMKALRLTTIPELIAHAQETTPDKGDD